MRLRLFVWLCIGAMSLAGTGPAAAADDAALRPPTMVRIDPAPFTMGHRGGEPDEGPPREIRLKPFAVAATEVTRGAFAAYVRASGAAIGSGCNVYEQGKLATRTELSWMQPGFAQGDDHPVVCISPAEAQAYAAWLAKSTGRKFRLLTEAEWEYVARAGLSGDALWASPAEACSGANLLDRDTAKAEAGKILAAAAAEPASETGDAPRVAPCSDGFVYTAPVGRRAANSLGLYDLIGNVWELTADCHADSLQAVPASGAAVVRENCAAFVVRGGAWVVGPNVIRLHQRGMLGAAARKFSIGFRVAEDISP
jgi:formylglycine-generating enzyme required for sulfatase activity